MIKFRCKRCGLKTARRGICQTCKSEQGIISTERLEETYNILKERYGDRKHGFANGEARSALPFNFEFTIKILEKLRNKSVLESKTISNSKRWYFTGQDLEQRPDNLRGKPCPECGNPLPSNRMKICDSCRDKKYQDNWEKIKPLFQEENGHVYRGTIKNTLNLGEYELKNHIDYWISGGLITDHQNGVSKYYTLLTNGEFNIQKYATAVKNSHRRRGFHVNIKTKEIVNAVKQSLEEGCFYCHKQMKPPTPGSKDPDILTIDIMNPSGNLEPGNFSVACFECNQLKGAQTHEQFTEDDISIGDEIMDGHKEEKAPVEEKGTQFKENPILVPIYEFEDTDKRLKSMIIDDMQRTNTNDKPLKTHLHLLKELENTEAGK